MQLLNVKESSGRKSRKKRNRLRLIIGLVVLIMIVGAGLSYKPAKQKYHAWKQQRALAQAKGFIANKDFPSAKLALQVALTAVPGDTKALRVAADLLEQAGSPQVMVLRRRLLQLDPKSLDDRVALINSALRFRDLNGARDALRGLPLDQTDDPRAIKVALVYAMVTDNRPIADALYVRLEGMEPDNERLKMMHALLRLKNPQPEIVEAALRELKPYEDDPRYALGIRRDRLLVAVQRKDHTEARRLAKLIAADPQATMNDRLHEANFALNTDKRPFAEVFATLTPIASKQPEDAAVLVRWAIMVGQPAAGKTWLKTLPKDMRSSAELLPVKSELAAALQDWDGLAELIEGGAWGSLDRDSIRLAFSAQLAGQRSKDTLRREIWDEALVAAGHSLANQTALYRLASIWNWDDGAESALWAITRAHPLEAWAHQTLFNGYRQRRDTDKMRALIGELRDLDGSTLRYRHDWALLTMLTTPNPNWNPAKQTMNQLYETDSTNANYVTGYAFALAQADKADQALEILKKLSPQELAFPPRAPYLAYIYGMARRPEDFAKAAAEEPNLPTLLPEEHALFNLGRVALKRPEKKRIESAVEEAARDAAEKEKELAEGLTAESS